MTKQMSLGIKCVVTIGGEKITGSTLPAFPEARKCPIDWCGVARTLNFMLCPQGASIWGCGALNLAPTGRGQFRAQAAGIKSDCQSPQKYSSNTIQSGNHTMAGLEKFLRRIISCKNCGCLTGKNV